MEQKKAGTMNIYLRINAVRKAVQYIQKDKLVTGHGYKVVTHDAVTREVRPHLIEHGIVCVPSLLESRVVPTGTTTGKGVPFIRYEAKYSFRFINADDPNDLVEIIMEAHAVDEGDKAPGKALSYAKKYAVLKLLEIETGEEDESRRQDERGGLTKDQIEDFKTAIDESKDDAAKQDIWKKIAGACRKTGDKEAYETLKAYLLQKSAKNEAAQ